MINYGLFGYGLRSELRLPELLEHPEAIPKWSIRALRPGSLDRSSAILLREEIAPPCTIRLHRTPSGYWLEHLCTGDYLISADGTQIEFQASPSAHPEAVRCDLLGRVMALALHVGGYLCLHGSATALKRGVVGFVAPKGYGKSTLASALVREGGRLVSDDLLVIEPGRPPMALPGVPRLRLRGDSFESTLVDVCSAHIGPDGKHVIGALEAGRLLARPAPLLGIYRLNPVMPDSGGSPVERDLIEPAAAARILVSMGKNVIILGQMETFGVLAHALDVAQRVPVYGLRISRDLSRIGEVARQMIEWHDADVLQPTLTA